MSVSDAQLIVWMGQKDPRVRTAALELITNSYATDPRILPAVFQAWDDWGPEAAFPDFPLISHLPIPADRVAECLKRAEEMSTGRKLTDRTCRCAGKLVEALSVCEPSLFMAHLDAIEQLKQTSKVFFRVPIVAMRERATALERTSSSLQLDFEDGQPSDIAIALEALVLRGDGSAWIERGFRDWVEESTPTPLAIAVLELASRRALYGHEESLLELMVGDRATIADLASIALVRCRSVHAQKLIAERFASMGRNGQLRSVDIIRRTRLPQSSNLLRYLLPLGVDFVVQDSIRVAEVLLFDFDSLEDWLEALLLADDKSMQRIAYAIPLAYPLAMESVESEWPRIQHLIRTRMGSEMDSQPPAAN